MTKRLVEIDDADLDAARHALDASTITETVTLALREAAATVARRHEVDSMMQGRYASLASEGARDAAWR